MPGVPPDAVDKVKRLLKGIFRRGKTKKQGDIQAPPSSNQPATNTLGQSTNINNSGALAIDKPLPPTQPLTTRQQDELRATSAQNHTVTPAIEQSAEAVGDADGRNVPSASPAAMARTEAAAAAPPKNDGAADGSNVEVPSAVPGSTEHDQELISSNENKENSPPMAPQPDSAIATPDTPAKPAGITEEAMAELPGTARSTEDKALTYSELSGTKMNPTTPGMSATSGPLEDFPAAIIGDKE